MKQVEDGIRESLQRDPIVEAVLGGRDEDDEPKIYSPIGKSGVDAPLVVFTMLPLSGSPLGNFGDGRSIEFVNFQISSWGTTRTQAWQLHHAIQEALERDDMLAELTPYKKTYLRRLGTPSPTDDAETRWIHIPVVYQLVVSR